MPDPFHILIVEDNKDDAVLLQRDIERAGIPCRFTIVGSVEEAQEKIHTDPSIDLQMADLKLPGTNGLETVKRLLTSLVVPPLVVVTGQEDEVLLAEATRGGADWFFTKRRYTPLELRTAITRSIVSARQRRAMLGHVASMDTAAREMTNTIEKMTNGLKTQGS